MSLVPGHKVLYIDYGNTECTAYLCQLPDDLVAIPKLATHCALAPAAEGDADDAGERLTEAQVMELLNSDTACYFDTVTDDDDGPICHVRMFRDAERTQEVRVAGAAAPTSSESDVADEPTAGIEEETTKEGASAEEFAGAVSWLNTSTDFYVQPKHLSDILEKVSNSLQNAPALGLVEPNVGELCVAKYVEDGLFYRARILSVESAEKNGKTDGL